MKKPKGPKKWFIKVMIDGDSQDKYPFASLAAVTKFIAKNERLKGKLKPSFYEISTYYGSNPYSQG